MTAYSDVPQVNTLYLEQQQVQSAIDFLMNGGPIASMVVSPPPPDPEAPVSPAFMMAVSIQLKPPNPPALVEAAIVALQARDDEIYAELAALGVTDPPVRKWKPTGATGATGATGT
jgi:hypothetical protein